MVSYARGRRPEQRLKFLVLFFSILLTVVANLSWSSFCEKPRGLAVLLQRWLSPRIGLTIKSSSRVGRGIFSWPSTPINPYDTSTDDLMILLQLYHLYICKHRNLSIMSSCSHHSLDSKNQWCWITKSNADISSDRSHIQQSVLHFLFESRAIPSPFNYAFYWSNFSQTIIGGSMAVFIENENEEYSVYFECPRVYELCLSQKQIIKTSLNIVIGSRVRIEFKKLSYWRKTISSRATMNVSVHSRRRHLRVFSNMFFTYYTLRVRITTQIWATKCKMQNVKCNMLIGLPGVSFVRFWTSLRDL